MHPELLCSAAAAQAHDDPAGSAAEFGAFLLISSPGAWGRVAADDAAQRHLEPGAAAIVSAGGRLRGFAIRSPLRAENPFAPGLPAYLGVVGGPLHRLDDLPGAADLAAVVDGAFPAAGTPLDHPVVAVCTNGSRDRCCAIHGRPIVTALAAAYGDAVTEISHLGGHRYAGTLLVLPTGYSYGFLDPAMAGRVVADAFAGLVHPSGLRGRADLPPAAQAAESFWRRGLGPAPPDAVREVRTTAADDGWTVDAVVDGVPTQALVHREPGPTVIETACGGKPFTTGRWIVRG